MALKNLLQELEQLDYQFTNDTEALSLRIREFEERLKGLKLPVTAAVDFPAAPGDPAGTRRRLVFEERAGATGLWLVEERPGSPEAQWTPLLKGAPWVRKAAPRLFGPIVEQMVAQAQKIVSGVSSALGEAERVLDDFGKAA